MLGTNTLGEIGLGETRRRAEAQPPVAPSQGDGGAHGGGKGGRQREGRSPYEYRGPQGGPDPFIPETEQVEPAVDPLAAEIGEATRRSAQIASEIAALKTIGADFASREAEVLRHTAEAERLAEIERNERERAELEDEEMAMLAIAVAVAI